MARLVLCLVTIVVAMSSVVGHRFPTHDDDEHADETYRAMLAAKGGRKVGPISILFASRAGLSAALDSIG